MAKGEGFFIIRGVKQTKTFKREQIILALNATPFLVGVLYILRFYITKVIAFQMNF